MILDNRVGKQRIEPGRLGSKVVRFFFVRTSRIGYP